MANVNDPHAITPELAWFSGWHDWERHLSNQQRHHLASTRAAFEPPDEIELPFERAYSGTPEAELGNLFASAAERLDAELKMYPVIMGPKTT